MELLFKIVEVAPSGDRMIERAKAAGAKSAAKVQRKKAPSRLKPKAP
jgi:hypothetical protein